MVALARAIALAACILTGVAAQELHTQLHTGRQLLDTTFASISVVVPASCSAVNVTSDLSASCGDWNTGDPIACVTSSNTVLTVAQRDTLHVAFTTGGASYDILGGSPTQDFVSGAIPGMVKDVSSPPSGSPSWANQTINGFYFTPASAALPVFGTPGNSGTLQLYVIDTGRSSSSGGVYEAPACRFSLTVNIQALTLPAITQDQLYISSGAAPALASPLPLLAAAIAGAAVLLSAVL